MWSTITYDAPGGLVAELDPRDGTRVSVESVRDGTKLPQTFDQESTLVIACEMKSGSS
jgi:hypothetical protein